MDKLKPCPFCGGDAVFPDTSEIYGAWLDDAGCINCGIATISIQICDYLTIEERDTWNNVKCRYGINALEKVRQIAIDMWNTRAGEENDNR